MAVKNITETGKMLSINPRFSFKKCPLAILAAMILALLAASCATMEEVEENMVTSWPPPPDPPRFLYEATLRTDLDIAKKTFTSRFEEAVRQGERKPRIKLVKPYDVAARKGRIIVSDTVTRVVYLFDIPRREGFYFGAKGDGKLAKPVGVAIDDDVNFYVADVSSQVVMVYDAIGHFKKRIGNPKDLIRPTDVAVTPDGERIFVVDTGGVGTMEHKVVVYDKEGEKLFTIGKRGVGDGEFNLPTQAAVAPDGTLYVLDSGNFRIQAFDSDGNFLRSWGKIGQMYGSLARPRGIGVDMDGNVYVTDATFRNFQVFDKEGNLLMFIGGKGMDDKPGVYVLPAGIAVDETNRIYIVDQYFKKLEVIRRLTDKESRKLAKER